MRCAFLPVSPTAHTCRLAAAILTAALSLVPGAANAQQQPFVDHLITFRSLLFGPYGDEGERIVQELEQLTGALAAWNESERLVDANFRLIPDRASKTPVFAPAAYAEGFEAIATGNYVRALARLRAATARDPLIIERAAQSRMMSLGIARLRAGRLTDAIAPLQDAVSAFGDSSEPHRILGTAYAAVGDYGKAVEQLRRAVDLAPGDERSRLALARVLRDAGRLDDAARFLRETLAAIPQSSEARWMLGDVLEKAGLGMDAARELEAAAAGAIIAGKAGLLLRAANLYERYQEFDRLIELLQQGARIDPNDPAVHLRLGLALSRLGRSDQALAELAVTDRMGGADAEGLTTIGQLLLEAGRLEEAASASQRAISLEPDRAEAHYVLGRALLQLARTAEAKAQLDAFERLRAVAMENQRRGFEIDALRAEARRRTAMGRHDEAATLWKRIVERMPLEPEFHSAAAEALAASGDLDAAAMEFERAASLGAGPVVQRRLAEVYAQLGEHEQSDRARRAYDQKVKELLKVNLPARQ